MKICEFNLAEQYHKDMDRETREDEMWNMLAHALHVRYDIGDIHVSTFSKFLPSDYTFNFCANENSHEAGIREDRYTVKLRFTEEKNDGGKEMKEEISQGTKILCSDYRHDFSENRGLDFQFDYEYGCDSSFVPYQNGVKVDVGITDNPKIGWDYIISLAIYDEDYGSMTGIKIVIYAKITDDIDEP